jgi:hypothetical protein
MILPMLAAIVGVVLAFGSSAFAPVQRHSFDPVWRYNGPDQSQNELNKAINYDQTAISCGVSGPELCTITAPSDGGSPAHPILSHGNVNLGNPAYTPVSKP